MSATEKSRFERLYVGPELRDEQHRLKIEAILDNYPDEKHLRKVYAFPNVDFRDEEDVPGGLIMVHPLDAPIHVDSIPEEAFQFLVVIPVEDSPNEPDGWKDAVFDNDAIKSALNDAVPQRSDNPPTLKKRGSDGRDNDTWEAELGPGDESAFAGIMKRVRDNGRHADYFVVVQAGAPRACKELKEWVAARPGMTFEDFIDSPEYSYVRYLARRNAERLAYNVARACKVPVVHTEDMSAYKVTAHSALPLRAEPPRHMRQPVSTLKPVVWGKEGEECVGIYHKVRPKEDVHDTCLVNCGPYEGITIFKMNGQTKGLGLPATTGPDPSKADATFSEKEIRRRHRGLMWEGGENTTKKGEHPEVHPRAHASAETDTFLAAMRGFGWKQRGTDTRRHFVPVIVKLSSSSSN